MYYGLKPATNLPLHFHQSRNHLRRSPVRIEHHQILAHRSVHLRRRESADSRIFRRDRIYEPRRKERREISREES